MSKYDLLTSPEAAARCGMSRSKFQRVAVTEGRITPELQLPGRTGAYLWSPAVLDAYLQEEGARSCR